MSRVQLQAGARRVGEQEPPALGEEVPRLAAARGATASEYGGQARTIATPVLLVTAAGGAPRRGAKSGGFTPLVWPHSRKGIGRTYDLLTLPVASLLAGKESVRPGTGPG